MSETLERKQLILDAVVRLYSETGQPVSSGLVARCLGGACSPATVRAEMTRLEDEGLIEKPHTSAGRIPTDAGFRAFVNRLLHRWPAGDEAGAAELAPMVNRELERSAGAHAMVRALASLLSRLTDNIGIILGPTWDAVRALRLELHPREGRRVLMVLVLENALVRTGIVTVEQDYPAEVLDDAARFLSERISGLTVAEIRGGVLPSLAGEASRAGRCALDLVEQGRELFVDVEEAEIELNGVARLLDEPEFSDAAHLKTLIRFIESPRTIRDSLRRLQPAGEDGISVWIGAENPVAELRPFSLVSSPYQLDGRRGVLAVLGLRRMPYQRTINSLRALMRSLNTGD